MPASTQPVTFTCFPPVRSIFVVVVVVVVVSVACAPSVAAPVIASAHVSIVSFIMHASLGSC